MNTPDQNPSWLDKKIAEINTHLQFDFRSPFPPDHCVNNLRTQFDASPYRLQVIIEAREAGAFYFHIMEYNPIGVQVEGNITTLGNGSLVDGRIIRPGCALTFLLLFVITPLLVIGFGLFILAMLTRNTEYISTALTMISAGVFFGYLFAWYSRRHRNYLRIVQSAVTTQRTKNSDKKSAGS